MRRTSRSRTSEILLHLLGSLAVSLSRLVNGRLLEDLHVAGVLLANLHANHAEEEQATEGISSGEDTHSLNLVVDSRGSLERGSGRDERPSRLGVGD